MRRPKGLVAPTSLDTQAWSGHLCEHPLAKGQKALGLRRWLAADRGEAPGAVQAACWLDVKRAYMALRPALRRMYVVVHDVPTYWPVVEQLGFRPIADAPVSLDGVDYTSVALDFGPGSVDGWLAGLVAAELGVGDATTVDEGARELSVQGQLVALTPLSSRCSGTYASERDVRARALSCSERSGGRSSRAGATSSTRSCARCGTSSGRRPWSSRRSEEAATACAQTGAPI